MEIIRSSKEGENGFTLLEVLVAVVILGLALAMLTGAITDSLMRAERVSTQNRVAALGDAILLRLGQDISLNEGISRGTAQDLIWTLVISQSPGPSSAVSMDVIDLTVRNRANHLIGHWQTLRAAPGSSEP